MYHTLFIHSLVDDIALFPFLVMTNNVAMNITVGILVETHAFIPCR